MRRVLTRSRTGPNRGTGLFGIAVVLLAVGALAAAGAELEDTPAPPRPAKGAPTASAGETVTVAWAAAPASLDPALATDPTGSNLAWNLMDPLVKLGPNLEPVPNLAEGWETSEDGRTVTFFLREEGRWTDGDRVTARDFEYAWKRTLSPALASPHATRLFAIAGAAAYHGCAPGACARLRRAVGVRALGKERLRIRLRSSVPWFVAATAHPAFLPVPRAAVERYGKEWTKPDNIVTSGPFLLAAMDEDSFTLTKNASWRNSRSVDVERVEGRIIPDPIARVQAFDSGDVTALDGSPLPVEDIVALRERAEHELYPALGTDAYAFNLAAIRDVHQRRAMAVAIDRRALVDNVVEGEEVPATRLTPAAAPELGREDDPSPWLPPGGDVGAAKKELARAAAVKRRITLLHVDAPGNRAVAGALRDAWTQLGIETVVRARARDEYLAFRGPLSAESADLYQVKWGRELPEAMSWLAPWTCGAARNKTNFCNPAFDALIARARRERNPVERGELYRRAEEILTGERGAVPVFPVYWRTYSNLEALAVKDSFAVNPLGQIDLSALVLP